MFSRLWLSSFGRFRNTGLSLSRMTVVHGGNETGKSTVFDAIVTAACELPPDAAANSPAPRCYGADAKVELTGEASAPPMAVSDMMGLFAVREGELSFGADAVADPAWQASLEPRLRAQTIDAAALAIELSMRASDDPGLEHNRELEELKERGQGIAVREAELRLAAERANALDDEQAVLAAELAEREAAIKAAQAVLDRDERRLALRRQCEEAARLEIVQELEALVEHEADLTTLETLTTVNEAELAEINRLHAEVLEHQAKLSALEVSSQDTETRLREVGTKLDDTRAAEPFARRVAGRAAVAATRLSQALAKPPMKEQRTYHWLRLVLGCVAWVVGVVSVSGLTALVPLAPTAIQAWMPYFGLVLGGLAGSVGLLTTRTIHRESDMASVLATLAAEWQSQDDLPALPEGSASEILGFLNNLVREHTELKRDLELHVVPQLKRDQELQSILARSRGMLEATLATRLQAHDAWLALRQVASRDAYAAACARRRETAVRIAGRLAEGKIPKSEQARAERKRELEAKLAARESMPADPEGPSPAALVERREAVERLEREREELDAQVIETRERRALLEGSCGVASEELNAAVAALTAAHVAIEEEIAIRQLEKQSAGAAAALYTELAKNPKLHFDLLAEAIADSLSAAGLEGVQVKLLGLSGAELQVSDADGDLRSVLSQSAGRRDLVILAARLALAERIAVHESPLVVLEEPFGRMSCEWRERGVRLVADFHKRTGWQLVLITRDPELARALSAQIPNATSIDLGSVDVAVPIAEAA